MAIRDQHFLYHLTSVENVPSILRTGLQPRAALADGGFRDIADAEIIEGRRDQELENYVPFHWFAKNPFDGRVYQDRPDEDFVLIAMSRDHARQQNWRVIPRHPLAGGGFELLDYATGFETIDWQSMELRDYHDQACKHICMAECLSPEPIPALQFAKIYTPSQEIQRFVQQQAGGLGLGRLWVDTNANMFPNR